MEHGLEVWSAQVRFVIQELSFEVVFVLDRKGGILQWELGGKAMVGGRNWSVERDQGAGLWSEVVQ